MSKERDTTEHSSHSAREAGDGDLQLVERIRHGDDEAFNLLCRRYEPRLRRFLFNLTRRPQIVEEVLNDTLMAVWQGAGTFKGTSKLSTWIFAIGYRKVMRALRRQDEPIEDPALGRRAEEGPGPYEEVENKRLNAMLAQAMESLSAEHRTVVELTYFKGLGYKEIAEIMNCPVDTVKTRMFYARRHLRELLPGDLSDWI